MFTQVMLLILAIIIAMIAGKLVSKLHLPAILGWLVTGMIIGPFGIGLLNDSLISSQWFHTLINFCEAILGLMIGSELIWKTLKKSGIQLLVICLTEALGAFILVSLCFGTMFYFMGLPAFLGLIFGGIALATAPAPSLSIVKEYKTDGPVTKTLIPLAALDDIVAVVVFFLVIGFSSNMLSDTKFPLYVVPLLIIIPLVLGAIPGVIFGLYSKKIKNPKLLTVVVLIGLALSTISGIYINNVIIGKSIFNLMLVGLAYSVAISNLLPSDSLHNFLNTTKPLIGIGLVIVILSLGMPLDYHLILGAGFFTFIYIISRALGKIGGAYIGGKISKAPKTVCNYLGLTLLPHSGVSLVFTGISVSVIGQFNLEYASIIQGTIAAAAVINEIIAVFLAKQGFKMAGEIPSSK